MRLALLMQPAHMRNERLPCHKMYDEDHRNLRRPLSAKNQMRWPALASVGLHSRRYTSRAMRAVRIRLHRSTRRVRHALIGEGGDVSLAVSPTVTVLM